MAEKEEGFNWSFGDTKELLGGVSNIYQSYNSTKVAEANATTAINNKRAIDSSINAQQSNGGGLALDTKTIAIGGAVALVLLVVVVKL